MTQISYWYPLSVLAFITLLALLLYRDRKKIERKYKVLFIRRTRKGRNFIDRVTLAYPRLWRAVGDVGVVIGFAGMIGGLFFLIKQITTPRAGPGLAFIVPSPAAEASVGYGYVLIPFWFFIIGIATLVMIHEGFHAIQVRRENVKIKSMGLALLAILPGAFVEPDERSLRKKSWFSQLRVYAAGSFGNFVLAGAVILALSFIFVPLFTTDVIGFIKYVEAPPGSGPYPAELAGLTSPIVAIDGQRVESTTQFTSILSAKKPGDTVTVETLKGTYVIKLASRPGDPSKAYLGVEGVQRTRILREPYRTNPTQAGALNFAMDLLAWIFTLNLGVGLVNLFPIKPLDGGLMLDALAKRFVPRWADDIMRASAAFVVVLILLTFFGGVAL